MKDKKGRFKKAIEDGITFNFTLPTLKKIFYFGLLIAIFFF